MTLKKKILITFLVLISIPILFAIFNFGNQLRKSITAKGKIISERQNAEETADDKVKGAINMLKQSGIVTNELGSSKVDVCYVTHEDQGWFAANWYQDCYLRYVEGFTTRLTKNEVKQKLVANSKTATYFGKEDTISVSSMTLHCGLFEDDYKTTLLYRPANFSSDEDSCEVPNTLQGIWSVKGPILLDDELSVKTYKTFTLNAEDNSQNQVWIMFDEYYYHEELGCGVGIIFCNNPRSKPVHPSI